MSEYFEIPGLNQQEITPEKGEREDHPEISRTGDVDDFLEKEQTLDEKRRRREEKDYDKKHRIN